MPLMPSIWFFNPGLKSGCIKENPPGGNPHMKGVGMLVVSLRGVNFEFGLT